MAEINEKLGINLFISGVRHHLVVSRDKEKYFRDGADLVNQLLNAYRENYQHETADKYNAVVMLDLAVKYLQCKEEHNTEPIMDSIRELNEEVEQLLGETK